MVDPEDIPMFISQYAEKCVEDMDIGTMEQQLIDAIVQRLEGMSQQDVIHEIGESCYSEIIED